MGSSKKTRNADPVKYSWQTLKDNSKRRGIPFDLSLDYFRQFCYEEDYIQNKGKTALSYTVDRVVNWLGYVEGNIRALTLAENARKGNKYLVYDWMTREARVVKGFRSTGEWFDD